MNAPREERPGSRQLHNMSTPPRMTIVIRPLRPAADAPARPRPTGLGTVDFDAIYRRGAAEKRWRRARDPLERFALVTEAVAGVTSPRRRGKPLDEELVDRIARAAALLDPDELGLPPVAALFAGPGPAGTPAIEDPRTAVCLLARLSGQLFVARRRPHAPSRELLERPVHLVAMGVADAHRAVH